MKTSIPVQVPSRTFPDVLLFIAVLGLSLSLKAEVRAGDPVRDAMLAKCTQILTYGESHQYSKPGKVDAVIALGLLGDERAVPVLIDHLQNEQTDQVRMEIVRSLGWIKSPSSVPALEAALGDKYLHVRKQAALALKEITGKEYPYDNTGEAEGMKKMVEIMQARKDRAGQTSQPAAPSGPNSP